MTPVEQGTTSSVPHPIPAASAAQEFCASFKPAFPVKQLAEPDALLGDDDGGGLDPVGGKDACRGDRTVGHNHAKVLASRLFAQSGGDAGEAKAFYHSGFQGEIHQEN